MESHEKGAVFGQIIDRLLAGEVLDVRRLREEFPEIGDDVLEQLRAYQDMLPRGEDGPSISTLGDYSIVRQVGRGGMGIVYEAWQNSINRRVALKVLPAGVAADSRTMSRFVREAHVAGKLKHPHIVSVYGMGVESQTPYYAMEFVDGETLAGFLSRQSLDLTKNPPESSVDGNPERASGTQVDSEYCSRMAGYFIGVAKGLYRAHQQGVIHRDVKPSNLMLESTESTAVSPGIERTQSSCGTDANNSPRQSKRVDKLRLLDFGLARYAGGESLTMTGDVVGTVAYMSPEQARPDRGADVDHRTDIYSLGATMYEALTLRPPLKGRDAQDTLNQIAYQEPLAPRSINPHLPRDLETIILRCLRKDPTDRYPDANSVAADLERFLQGVPIEARPQSTIEKIARQGWRSRRLVAVVTVVSSVVLPLAFFSHSQQRDLRELEWVQKATPRIQKSIEQQRFIDAFQLVQRALKLAPEDSTIQGLRRSIVRKISATTDPPGAKISIREYENPDGIWLDLGRSPLTNVEAPVGNYRWRLELPSFGTQYFARKIANDENGNFVFELGPLTGPHAGMKRISAGEHTVSIKTKDEVVDLSEYWIDQREVTNAEYQQFVDAGGYERKEFWRDEFVLKDSKLTFDDAIRRFRDGTGELGPSTWSNGRYMNGTGDHPVSGVSWYEASAYARFCQKSLPTIFHWRAAAALHLVRDISPYSPGKTSNIGTDALAPAGKYPALTPVGLQDMIGNVKEWCTNRNKGSDNRFALGGSWKDPAYSYAHFPSYSPWNRGVRLGFRCVRHSTDVLSPKLHAAIDLRHFDHRSRQPVSHDHFEIYKEDIYGYTRGNLDPVVTLVRETDSTIVEIVTLNTAYNERFPCLLYLPKGVKRPLQAMIKGGHNGFWQPSHSRTSGKNEILGIVDSQLATPYLFESGRALLIPAQFGHFGRTPGLNMTDAHLDADQTRLRRVRQIKDVMRLVDYIETRDDFNLEKLGYIAGSSGAQKAPIMLAIEHRLRLGILSAGGLYAKHVPATCDPFNFAPYVTQPVLMINGKDDILYDVERSQKPLFDLLGTPAQHKRHRIYPGDHGFAWNSTDEQVKEVRRDIVNWLDEYFGVPERVEALGLRH